jgi:membrane protein
VSFSWHSFWWLFRRSFVLAYRDNCFGIAKGAAYSALLSFFPLLTATAAILVQVKAQAISPILSRALSEAVPPGTEELVMNHFRAYGERPTSLLVVATLVSIWAASRVMTSLIEGFQAAYHIPQGRPFLRQQGIAILLVFSAAVPAVLASSLILLGGRTERTVLGWLGLVPAGPVLQDWVRVAGMLLRYTVALGTIVLVSAMLYHLGPNRPQRWRHVWPGAVLATVLWLSATLGFTWYMRDIADYNLLYGSIGAVIALLVWMYVLAAIAMVGCEFNAEYERIKALH